MRTALHDAAKQAALDERDRLGADITDYVVGRIVEAALAVRVEADWRPLHPPTNRDVLDIDSWELG